MQPTAEFLDPAAAAEPKSRAKSCTECRQVKLKCDYRERAPDPCTRCVKRGLECKKDATFKRVPSRVRRQQQQQSASRGVSPVESSPSSIQSFSRRGSVYGPQPTIYNAIDDAQNRPRLLQLQSFSASESFTLGEIVLSGNAVLSILRHFDNELWDHLPILEPCFSLSRLHQESAVLFWTLIAVSCRLHPERQELYAQISARYQASLYQQLFVGPPSIKKLHAVLLLCLWPFSVISQETDASYMLCGAAINCATMLGLHRLSEQQDFYNLTPRVEAGTTIMQMTWLACIQISTSMFLFLNLPPPVSNPSALQTVGILSTSNLQSPYLRAGAMIDARATRLVINLEGATDMNTSQSLLQEFERDTANIRTSFLHNWNSELEAELLATNLYAVGLSFVPQSTDLTSTLEAARGVMQRGLALATSLVATIAQNSGPWQLPTISGPPPESTIYQAIERTRFFPKPYFRHLIFAAHFLLFYISTPLPNSGYGPSNKNASSSQMPSHFSPLSPTSPKSAAQQAQHMAVAHASLDFATKLLTSMPNPEGVRVGRSIIVKAKYASAAGPAGARIQATSRLAKIVLSAFDKVDNFLRQTIGFIPHDDLSTSSSAESSLGDAAETMMAMSYGAQPRINTGIGSTTPSPQQGQRAWDHQGPSPIGSVQIGGIAPSPHQMQGGWVSSGQNFDMSMGHGLDDEMASHMGQVFSGMDLSWDIGTADWVDYAALAQQTQLGHGQGEGNQHMHGHGH